jgi:glycosyltransferase involved in cell wall biosynthesis
VKTLRYLADVRMPTEKAYGWQMVKMCGAFAAAGVRVELCTPRRRQPSLTSANGSVFDYYGVAPAFAHQRLPDIDLVVLEQFLPSMFETSVNQLHSYVWARYAIAREASRPRPDLLYTRDLGIAVRALAAGLPLAWEVHRFPGERGRRMLVGALRSGRPRVVAALTPFLRDELVDMGFRSDEVIVEGDAIDPVSYARPPSREEARSTLRLPSGPLVGFVGRFQAMEAERGMTDLIHAIARVDIDLAPTLVLVGGPMDVATSYRAEAARAGLPDDRLLIVDRVPNAHVPVWLRALDIGVMPYPNTRHYALELSPLKMFEYMAAGLPIVASDLPSIRLHLEDGVNALLGRPGDPVSSAEAITRLLRDPGLAERLASRARDDVAGLTWDARAQRILASAGVTS